MHEHAASDTVSHTLIALGAIFLAGLVTELLGRRTFLPRVTLLLLFGLAIGPSGMDILPSLQQRWFPEVSNMALVMVGFLLGGRLTKDSWSRYGKVVLWNSLAVVVGTAVAVATGLILLGFDPVVALLLAAASTATDPVATTDSINEIHADGPFSRTLIGIVALDDAMGLVVFGILVALAQLVAGNGTGVEAVSHAIWEIGGAVLVGGILGIPAVFLTGRISPGEPTLVEALGIVFLCGGIAMWLNVSFLLASMVLGMAVSNLATHHNRPFHAIEGIEWPFMILFFVLAGAALDVSLLPTLGLIGSAYVAFRVLGRVVGAWIGGGIGGAGVQMRRWMGVALLPQAGVAIGMALVAAQQFPEHAGTILPVVIGATVIFEIAGPILTRRAVIRVGEAHQVIRPAVAESD